EPLHLVEGAAAQFAEPLRQQLEALRERVARLHDAPAQRAVGRVGAQLVDRAEEARKAVAEPAVRIAEQAVELVEPRLVDLGAADEPQLPLQAPLEAVV